jgi:pimeloyl-[acyl-carrier protein] methyl ester esterase
MGVKAPAGGPHLVLLHGWGMHAGVWDDMAALLAPHFRVLSMQLPAAQSSPDALDAMAAALARASPSRAIVCGWSLGGQVALRWMQLHPEQVERVVLISSTPRFVNGPDWNHGMAPGVFKVFAESLEQDVNATLQRFVVLQAHRDEDARNVVRRLSECVVSGDEPVTALANGLALLQRTDLRPHLPAIEQRVLIMHGDRDAVVPLGAGEYLQRSLPRAEIEVISGSAHAPFIGQPEAVARRIVKFGRG